MEYRHLLKDSTPTSTKLCSGKAVNTKASKAYVGKGRVLREKDIQAELAKFIQKEEDAAAAGVKTADDQAKAVCEQAYRPTCDAALTTRHIM